MTAIDDRIARLQQQLAQAKAAKAAAEARARVRDGKAARKADARKKILIGAAVLARVASGAMTQERLLALMDEALTRADDRALFGLPAKDTGGGAGAQVQGESQCSQS